MPITNRPLLARARVGDEVLAESVDARRLDPADAPPSLWFPRAAVRTAAHDHLLVAGSGELEGWVGFDDPSVQLELVDDMASSDPRDVTVKRFPTAGDLADLVDLLDVLPSAAGHFVGAAHHDGGRPVIEGSQLLAQTLVAAARRAPGRRAVSASMAFARVATTAMPLEIHLDEVANGRTFTVLTPRITQGGKTCATGMLLLDVMAPDVIRHDAPMPDVPGPYEATPVDLSITGRDVRVVDNAYVLDSAAPAGPPELDVWIRFREVPDDQALHVALFTHITGLMSLAAALRPHVGLGLDQAHKTISTGVNAISLAIHREIRADEWMLYHHRSTFAGDGMTHSECRAYDQAGHLLASFAVAAMLRSMSPSGAATDSRPAM